MTHLPDQEIEQLWTAVRHLAETRLALIEQALEAATAGRSEPDLFAAAREAAHNLAGSLGSFRRAQGSQAAQDAETALRRPTVDRALLCDAVPRLRASVTGAPGPAAS